jgi:hypothetical protein
MSRKAVKTSFFTKEHLMIIQRQRVWLDTALLVVLFIFVVAGKNIAPFHGDEATFIKMSQDYDHLIKMNGLAYILYRPDKTLNNPEQRIRTLTGSVNSFEIGMVRDVVGISENQLNNVWDWNYPPNQGEVMWLDNIENNSMPSLFMLKIARYPSSIMGGLSVVFLFFCALQYSQSRLVSWTTTILYATNAEFLLNVRRAMAEGSKLFFLVLTFYLSIYTIKEIRKCNTNHFGYWCMGIASGLTLACKQDVALSLFAIYGALALIPWFKREYKTIFLINLSKLAGSACLALAVFFVCMPVWWNWWINIIVLIALALFFFNLFPNTPGRKIALVSSLIMLLMIILYSPSSFKRSLDPILIMAQNRKEQIKAQLSYRTLYHLQSLNTFSEKTSFMMNTFFFSKAAYSDSPRFDISPMFKQIDVYASSFLDGRNGLYVLDIVVSVFFFIGLGRVIRRFNLEDILVFCVFVFSAVVLSIINPLPISRYYLTLQIFYALLSGLGIQQALPGIKQLFYTDSFEINNP